MAASKDVQETTAMGLGDLLDAEDGAIVTLVAGDTRLAVHRAVLVARSPVFTAMFSHDMMETSSGQVAIPDMEGPVLRQLMSYLYTLQAPQMSGTAPQLLAAADKYLVSGLKTQCEQHLSTQLTVENAVATAILAMRHSCSSLKQAALTFIKTHAFDVMATQGWAEAMLNQPKDLIEVGQLLYNPPAETRAPATTDSRTTATTTITTTTTTTTTTTAIAATAATATTTTVATTNATVAATAATTASAFCQPHSSTPAAAATRIPPPDKDAVSRMQSLSKEERGRRLIKAAKNGEVGEVRVLLAAGVDVEARGEDEMTALHYAADRGHVYVAICLLEAGAQVGARTSLQWTPLHLAAYSGHTAVVCLLLSWSADPNARNRRGRTPLHWAAQRGRADVADALLKAGADKRARDERGNTPLDLARQENKQQLLWMLL